ncbi:DUF6119 family protein [Acrocarpospora sp. B8E8]|uniref:DUF6119 family protein n=1 Tax=Acrocarpospora sp. B8E8 TaxID=3153572 RepID=UPI00325C67C7
MLHLGIVEGRLLARPPAQAHKTSLYRLLPPDSGKLRDCIQGKYLDQGFEVAEVRVGGTFGILVSGVIANTAPKWLPHVESLTGLRPDVYNYTSAAVLLLPLEDHVFALSWGFGHLIINQAHIDSSFGLRFALRRANPGQIRSLTYHTMDTLARTARTTVPGGAVIDAFGMEELGEIISRMVGKMPATGLTASRGGGDDTLTIRGADGLNIPLAREGDGLVADLRFLNNVVENEPPAAGLEHFEHTRPLQPGHPATDALIGLLGEALGAKPHSRIALSWPAEWEQEHGEAHSYALDNAGRGFDDETDDLELEFLLAPVSQRLPEARIGALKRLRVIGKDSDGNPISRAIPGTKWVTFETDLGTQRYVFHQGRWFNIGGAYLDMLKEKMSRIFAQRSSLALPPWPNEVKKKGPIGRAVENRYNLHVTGTDATYLCLDRQLVRTKQHPRGIEVCDLLGPTDELIHVKHLVDSVSASHLFNQALVSAEALRHHADTIIGLRGKISELSGGARTLPDDFRPTKIVLAFGGREATPEALMTFSQVTLARCAQRLAELGFELEVTEIADSSEVLPLAQSK